MMKTGPLRSPRFALLLLSLAIAFALSSTSHASTAELTPANYSYPFTNQFVSTLAGAVAHSTKKPELVPIEVRKDRRNVKHLEGRNKITLRVFRQPHTAPIMFVVPGLGGHTGSGTALMLAETFFDAGYTVVTLPNNLSWQYALSVSETAIPGYMPRDSAEFYEFLKLVANTLKYEKNVQGSSYSIAGYSLGALLTAFVAKIDEREKHFAFDKVVLFNPAIDLEYGIGVLDTLYDAGNEMSAQQKTEKMGFALNLGADLMEAPMSLQTFQSAAPKLSQLKENEMRWMIGQSFRQSVRDVIVTGQRVNNTGPLRSATTKYKQNAQLDEASRYSYTDYMNKIVYTSVANNKLSPKEVLEQSSLYSLTAFLVRANNIFVFENADDLIIKKSDLNFLKLCVGNRLRVYPYGGHLGNLWWDQNKKDLLTTLSPAQ